MEPLSYRMQMLVGQTRLARCLTGVRLCQAGTAVSGAAVKAWPATRCTVAISRSSPARAPNDSGVRVERISAMVDCGRLINPESGAPADRRRNRVRAGTGTGFEHRL